VRCLFFLLTTAAAFAQPLAIRNVTAVDTNGARRITVVITGKTITSAAANARIPSGAKVIDGTGKFLIPGLWDMHVHLWEQEPMFGLYLAAGVTGIRDMGSDPQRTLKWKSEIEAGRMLGPTVFTSGPILDGPATGVKQAPVLQVANADDGRNAVDQVDLAGLDFIMVMSRVPTDAYFSLAHRARIRRAPFAGHVPESVSVWDAVEARQKSVEHLFGMALACSYDEKRLRAERLEALANKDYAALDQIRQRTYSTFSQPLCSELFRRMARFQIWQTPTLALAERRSFVGLERRANDPELTYVPDGIRKTWKDPREEAATATAEQLESLREDYKRNCRMVAQMQSFGVGILAGTDTGDPYVVPGFALHDELESLVAAGLTPLQALNAATINPARYFNIESTHGTIEKGKLANAVLLDADPLADIRNITRISSVIVNGRLLQRTQLDSLKAGRPIAAPPATKKQPRRSVARRPRR
jgi:hypothetical protein